MSPELSQLLQDYLGLVVGAGIALLGFGLKRRHDKTWIAWQRDRTISEGDRSFYKTQYRRRIQAAALLIAIGTLIAAGDLLIPWDRIPTLFAVYWGVILLMAMWLMLLAIGDLVATGVHNRHSLSESRERLQGLRSELDQIRELHSNETQDAESRSQF